MIFFLILLNQKHLTSALDSQRVDIFNLPTDIDIGLADSHSPVHDYLKIMGVTIEKQFTLAPPYSAHVYNKVTR